MMASKRGVSIVASVVSLLILSVFGSVMVVLVATEQQMRIVQVYKSRAFYTEQAGFEYAIREIKGAGYPVVTDKSFANGTFTTAITYNTHKITSVGTFGTSTSREGALRSITYTPMAGDCITINASTAAFTDGFNNVLDLVLTQNICLPLSNVNAVNFDKVMLSWVADAGEKAIQVWIDGTSVYDDPTGTGSGLTIDTTDFWSTLFPHTFKFKFSASMAGKTIRLRIYFTDTSYTDDTQIEP